MDSSRLRQIQALFHEAADLPQTRQHDFLEAACGDDDDLMAHVLAMLAEDARGGSLLDVGVARVAQRVLGAATRSVDQLTGFGPYRLRHVIGEGGMGVVYLAERKDLGSLVAIKVLRDAGLSPARRERFATEQRMLAHLSHPSIARLYDADTLADGTPWFVMEYVKGVSITEYCRQIECSLEQRLRLFRAVCEAVQYAHEHAVIHRDLKPSNILVNTEGGVRLLDFGIAKQLEALDQPVDQTRTALRLMTPAYAAPEQIRGEPVGVFTDVYALGIVLYELLAGRPPFDLSTRTAAEAERIIVEQVPQKPSAAVPGNQGRWGDLDVLCLTALQKEPGRRYRSVEALIRDIDHYLKSEPLEARPDTLGYRLGKFVRRHRRAVSAAAFAFTALVALVVFFTVRLAIARTAAETAATRAQRVQQFMLNLFEGGDKEAGPAEGLRVVTLLDRGVQEARMLNRERAVQADLYETLGSLYRTLGDFGRADSLLRAALDERKSLFGSNHHEVSNNSAALGLLRIDQAKFDEAEQWAREGLQQASGIRPVDNQAVGKATFVLGKVMEARGAYDKAIPLLEEAVKLQSAAPNPTLELAASLTELANSHFYAGHYDASDAVNRRALTIERQFLGERHPKVADSLVNLGAAQKERGNYRETEQFYREALDITEGWYGHDHPETAGMLYMLGNVLGAENRYEEAAGVLERALAIRRRVYGEAHPRVGNVLNDLGMLALKQGNLDEADARLRRVFDIYKNAYGEHHYLVALALSNLASVSLEREEYAHAEQLYRESVARYTETVSANHLYTGTARIKLGHALVVQRRYAEAEGETLAGYQIVVKQASPSLIWLQTARKDLATIYDALHQPERAASFRGETAK
jgi:tetratricopeptide (TPR) repeat protein